MADYLSINEVKTLTSEACQCTFIPVQYKKIMFVGKTIVGKSVTLCTPRSKFHPKQGFYWIDITEEQCRVMNKTDNALVVFRLEGRQLVMVQWEELNMYLIPECMRFNDKERNHWKLNIYSDHIKISGNENKYKTLIVQY